MEIIFLFILVLCVLPIYKKIKTSFKIREVKSKGEYIHANDRIEYRDQAVYTDINNEDHLVTTRHYSNFFQEFVMAVGLFILLILFIKCL
jgi:hypothetical protein